MTDDERDVLRRCREEIAGPAEAKVDKVAAALLADIDRLLPLLKARDARRKEQADAK